MYLPALVNKIKTSITFKKDPPDNIGCRAGLNKSQVFIQQKKSSRQALQQMNNEENWFILLHPAFCYLTKKKPK